jgi:hypothetical protein
MYVLVIYTLLGALTAWSVWKEENRNRKLEWILYGITALFFLIRFSIGQDTDAYNWLFVTVENPWEASGTSHMMRNFGYTFLNWIIKQGFGEFRWFVLFSNTLILGLTTWTVYKHSRYPLMSMMLFVGSGMLEVYYGSGLRQGIAMALFLFAFYQFLPKKQYLWYEVFVLLALGCQEIAFVLIPIPLLLCFTKRFKAHPYRTVLITTVVIGILSFSVMRLALDFSYLMTYYAGYEPVWTHLLAYLQMRDFSLMGFAMETVFLAGIMVLYYFAEKKDWLDFSHFEVIVFVYSVLLYYLLAGYSIMSRVSDMIQIIILILLPELVHSIPVLSRKMIALAGIFALNFVLLYVDLREKCRIVSSRTDIQMSLEHFPYITVFDGPTIEGLYED